MVTILYHLFIWCHLLILNLKVEDTGEDIEDDEKDASPQEDDEDEKEEEENDMEEDDMWTY